MQKARALVALAGAAFAAAFVSPAKAADYPDHPVRIVVPFPAGGTVDLLARHLAAHLEASLKQPFIVDNRPGAGGNTGTASVARSAPDGYTMLVNTVSHAVSPGLYRKLPYDPNDFAAVSQLTVSVLVLVSSADLPAKDVRDIVALAKKKPGALNYGSTGPGSVLQLAMELFKIKTGTDIVQVPYRGDAAVMEALLRNDVQLAVTPLPVTLPHIESGRVRAIAVTNEKRTPVLPNLKTIEEEGIPGFRIDGWHGLLMPAGTDSKIVELIQQESAKALATPQMKDFLAQSGLYGVGSTPAAFSAKMKSDMDMFATIIREAKIPQID